MRHQPGILVVDDEADYLDGIVAYLRRHGFAARGAANGEEMRQGLAQGPVDLVLLDLSMPGEDGLGLLRWLRARSALPVIMLTATAEPFDRTIGLELGADDYVTKPCDPRELLARIKSVLRRATPPTAGTVESGEPASLDLGPCHVDLRTGNVTGADGVRTQLTAMELRLLRALARCPGQILDRDRLTRLAYGRERDRRDRGIDSRISHLRRLIEADPAQPRFLRTVRGAGYLFEPGG